MEKETKGFFGNLRKAMLPTDEEKAAKAQYLANSKPTVAAPTPEQGISGYAGNGALDKRMKAAGLKNGGAVRKKCVEGGEIEGPGGPTDDLVPIDASNGEFMIKASSAKILGEDVLEALNDLGDEPKDPKDDAAEDAKEGEGMKCGGKVKKMATGGFVEEEDPRLSQIPTAGSSAPAYDGRSNGNDFTRNVNNNLNSLGGMGVVASAPLKAAAATTSGLGAIKGAMKAPAMLANGVPGADFIAGASGVAQVGGANLPSVINSAAPVAKSVNVALQEGALANQAAAATRSLGNASAGLGVLDGQQTTAVQPAPQPAPQPTQVQPTVAAGAIPFKPATAPQGAPQVENQDGYLPGESITGRMGRRAEAAGAGFLSGVKSLGQKMNLGAPGAATGMPFNSSAGAGRGAVPAGTPVGVNEPIPAAPAAGTAPQSANQPQPAAAGYRGKGFADPRDQSTPTGVAASEMRNEFSNTATLARNPGGAVRKITDASGRVTGYSGGNVTGDVAMVDANGVPLRGNTRGISSMDTSAGAAADVKQLAAIEAGKVAQNADIQAQADFHANKALEERALRGNPAALALLKGRMASSDSKQSGQMTDQTTRRGQDLQAGALRQTNQLAQDKFGLDATGAKLDNEQKASLVAIQKAMFDPKATPEQRAEATKQYMVLNGKAQTNQYDFAPGGQTVIDGQLVTQPGVIFNKATGDAKTQGAQPAAKALPNAGAIALLKSNPKMAADFDAKFGAGASKQILGQ